MAITVTVNSVTTGDAAPTTEPHRISDKAGKDTAEVVYAVATDDDSAIRAIRIRLDGSHRNDGPKLLRRGMVCGDGVKCGEPDAYAIAWPEGQRDHGITYASTGPAAEGTHDVNLYAASLSEGWA